MAMLGACAVGPDYHAPAFDLPADWSTARNERGSSARIEDLSQWWTRFEDPVLNDLITRAIENNPDRAAALASIREARARAKIAGASRYPAIDAGGAAGAYQSGSADWNGLYSAGLDASWEADIFGGVKQELKAAEATLQAREAAHVDVLTSLTAEVAVTYVEIRTLQERLRLTRASIVAQEETFDQVRWRAEAGLTSSLDVEQARANFESTRAQIPTLQDTLANAFTSLSVLLGESPGIVEATLTSPSDIPVAEPINADVLPADLLRQRADLRSAERNLAAQSARVGVATTALYPRLTLSGSLGASADDLSGLLDETGLANSLVSSLSAPVFNAGALRANVEAEDAVLEQALASYESAVLLALKEVEDALSAASTARARSDFLDKAVRASQQAYDMALLEYQTGLVDFQTVLDTQRTLLSLQDDLAQSQAAETNSQIATYKALGGGWSQTGLDPNFGR